jgi:N utilization substance protein A
LSLAIGKEGQNARLAARLTGWRIDIRSDAAPEPEAPDTEKQAAAHTLDEPRQEEPRRAATTGSAE